MARTINEGLCGAPTFTPHRVNVTTVDGTGEARATLDLGTEAVGNIDAVVEAREPGADGNNITVRAVGDSGGGAGVTIAEVGSAVTIHYESTVSTEQDVEDAITLHSTLIRVKTPGTGATVLDVATDDFAADNLADGADGFPFLWGMDSRDWREVVAQINVDGASATVEVLLWSEAVGDFISSSPAQKWTTLAAPTTVRFETDGQRFFLHCSGTFTRIDIDVAGATPG